MLYLKVIFAGVIAVGATILAVVLVSRCHRYFAMQYLKEEGRKLYFCGHDLEQIIEKRLLPHLETYLKSDISRLNAILIMLALHDNTTARIGYYEYTNKGQTYCHAWAEFRYMRRWYVFDPSWCESDGLLTRGEFGRGNTHETEVASYEEFWQQPLSEQFYRKIQHISTSHLFYEMYLFAYNSERLQRLDENSGFKFIPFWQIGDRPLTMEIFRILMSSTEYRAPTNAEILQAFRGGNAFYAEIPRL